MNMTVEQAEALRRFSAALLPEYRAAAAQAAAIGRPIADLMASESVREACRVSRQLAAIAEPLRPALEALSRQLAAIAGPCDGLARIAEPLRPPLEALSRQLAAIAGPCDGLARIAERWRQEIEAAGPAPVRPRLFG